MIWQITRLEQQEQLLTYKKFWLYWEKTIKSQKMEEKYSNLVSNAIAANSLDAKFEHDANKTTVDFDYILRAYSAIPDDKITVSDAEIRDLYSQQKERFVQGADMQVISFISVNVVPSQDDYNKVLSRLEEIKPEFAAATETDITEIVNSNSDTPFRDMYLSESSVHYSLREFVKEANTGELKEPFLTDNVYSMAKLLDKKVGADSIKLNQIMLSAPNEEALNRLADSLITVINGGTSFQDVARTMTNGQTDGDMGWTTEAALVQNADEKFKNEVFEAALNRVFVAKSGRGTTHLVQVTERTAPVTKYKLAEIQISVSPSTETSKKMYNELSQYVAKYSNNIDSFQLAAPQYGYYCQKGVQIQSNEQFLPGVLKSRPVIRWAFEHKKGEVSDIYDFDNKFVVAAVENSLKKGYRPVEDVADLLRAEILKNKKAEVIISDMNSKKYSDLNNYAQDFGGTVRNVNFVTFTTPNISGIGSEPVLNAMAPWMETGKISEPLKGEAGVYLISLTNKKDNETPFNAVAQKQSLDMSNSYRVGYQAVNVLIDNANIKDNRINFY
jgi:PPIC-type PPIASE domain.